MDWKLDDSRPIWPQLKEQLIIGIIAGRYPMGGAFPTVRELAEDAGVNRNTRNTGFDCCMHREFARIQSILKTEFWRNSLASLLESDGSGGCCPEKNDLK